MLPKIARVRVNESTLLVNLGKKTPSTLKCMIKSLVIRTLSQ